MELLLQHGASVYQASANGMTPLQLAVLGTTTTWCKRSWLTQTRRLAAAHAGFGRSSMACCMRCTSAFELFCSKHHCRYCGCAVCTDCSGGDYTVRWLAHQTPCRAICTKHTASASVRRLFGGSSSETNG